MKEGGGGGYLKHFLVIFLVQARNVLTAQIFYGFSGCNATVLCLGLEMSPTET